MAHPTHIPGSLSPRASFHSPLHCMLYINKISRDYINKNTPRITSRSCRGDREVGRPSAWRTPRPSRCRCHRGRASTRPYIACCSSTKCAGITSKNTPCVTSRSCRGDWKVARRIRMAHPRTFRGCCHRGRASTRPYIACCKSIKHTRITSTKTH